VIAPKKVDARPRSGSREPFFFLGSLGYEPLPCVKALPKALHSDKRAHPYLLAARLPRIKRGQANWSLDIKVIDTAPGLRDSITPWHRPLSRETNLESEIGFLSLIPRSTHPLLTREAESDQIVLDSKLSLEDLSFSNGASTHKRHCVEINETDWPQTYDKTFDQNAETVCDL
jgi:hypothetical protein